MINSIGSGTSAMSMLSSTQRPQQGKDMFQLSDTDGNGVVSETELTALAAGIEEATGNSINVDDALASYDSDSDGGLSGEELMEMLDSNGFSRPEMEGEAAPPPPPPPSSEDAMSAYSENSGDDLISSLMDVLGNSEDDTETSLASSISITS